MRSKLMTAAAVAASTILGASVAAADPVQEQLRLMEQRMAEMEDRLQATSEELKNAQQTVEQQQAVLSEAGLAEDDGNVRSAVGTFFQQVDVSGLAAASYNYRFLGGSDKNLFIGDSLRHQNADSFSLDQLWLTLDKPTNEESRAGFHADMLYGASAQAMRNTIIGQPLSSAGGSSSSTGDQNDFYLFSAYVSYLAPIGNGIRFDLGKRGTLMGIERVKTNVNFNVTQGIVFRLIPITNTGLLAETNLTDELSIAAGVFNDVYSDTSFDDSRHKAYFSQIKYTGDRFTFKVDSMVGKSSGVGLLSDNGGGTLCDGGNACQSSVLEAVATAQLTESLEAWFQYAWARQFGNSIISKGDTHALATAARYHITDDTSVAARVEYLRAENDFRRAISGIGIGQTEIVTATFTGAQKLTTDLTLRAELRYDRNYSNGTLLAIDNSGAGNLGTRDHQLVGLAELYYEF
ncbi:MAG: outer membrane beta-barrel protein [Myxococcota bacterium]